MAKRLGIAVVIQNDAGETLLMKRGDGARDESGAWENVGGAVEPDETVEQAIVREVHEELGVQLTQWEKLFDFDSVDGQWHVTHFRGQIDGVPSIQEPDKCTAIGWYQPEEIAQLKLSSYALEDFKRLGIIQYE